MKPESIALLVSGTVNGVNTLTLNRAQQRNAITTPLLKAISDQLTVLDQNPSIRCVIVTGSESVFAAGADANEILEKGTKEALEDIRPALWSTIRAFRKPLIAAVEGWCLGAGCELAMCCDMVIAGAEARFGQPETNLGIMPGAGGTATLPRLVGRSIAMKMVLLGETITAKEAMSCGLVLETTVTGDALRRSEEIANKLASRAPLALQNAKASLKAAFDLSHEDHLKREREHFSSLFSTEDKQEGISAFLNKRAPVWKGR